MAPTRQELIDVHCYFAPDRVGDPEMTAFKQEARLRQHRWAIDELGLTEFGTHGGAKEIVNGTKLTDGDADKGLNFLSDDIAAVAKARLDSPQKHQTLEPRRLRRDLLSSMPMAFNLFGEASLHAESRAATAGLFGLPSGEPSDVIFEWSPERLSEKYTRDRTAFDVALRFGDPAGPRSVVGIETKYHEHSAREQASTKDGQTNFLVTIAEASGVFVDGWKDKVLPTDLRQIWRDHLLALSMRKHSDQWTSATKYALVFPARNVSFADAAERYKAVLRPGDNSFLALTVEQVVGAAFAHGGPTAELFKRRYLW